jgi:hypothetical protein
MAQWHTLQSPHDTEKVVTTHPQAYPDWESLNVAPSEPGLDDVWDPKAKVWAHSPEQKAKRIRRSQVGDMEALLVRVERLEAEILKLKGSAL